jgi:Uma2 family endonuclease
MPAIAVPPWSADAVRALPDEPGKRFECVDGELLVSPGPRLPHQSAVTILLRILDAYCEAQRAGAVFTSPGELELDAFTLVQPDVYVLPLVQGRRPCTPDDVGHPLLLVEVLSPSTARFDRVVKRQRYQRLGVEYWIVDLDARVVERWLPTDARPEVLTDTLIWLTSPVTAPCVVDLPRLFDEALGAP